LVLQDSTAWKLKGLDLADLKRFDEAVKAYDKEIEIDPHDSKA
jgi:tetratricopeptide (TPR) repeat protein